MLASIQHLINLIRFQSLIVLPCIVVFVYYLYKWLHTKSDARKRLPPSPPKLPIIGNLHQLSLYPHRTLRSLSEKYGELMLIYLGQSPTPIVSSAKSAREILKTHDIAFSNRPTTKTTNKLLYNGKDLGTSPYGEYWRHMRTIFMQQVLSNKKVGSFRHLREEETNRLVEKIQKVSESSESSPVNLTEIITTLANDLICKVAFRKKYSGDHLEYRKLIKELLQLLGSFRVGDFIPWLAWTNRINGWDAKVDKVARELDQFLEQVVKEHEQDHLDNSIKEKDGENYEQVKSFVDVLLDAQKDDGFHIQRDTIKALILALFTGGTDAIYTLLEWAMTELLRHPTIMQRVQKEVRGITGGNSQVNEDDLEQMKYLKAVIKETLRLHPSSPLLIRLSAKDTKVNGFDIPKGTMVMINIWAIQRDSIHWEEPDIFNPDRFLNSSIDYKGQDFQFLPFGAGRRTCPGMLFSTANAELVLANLMHKFDWALPDGVKVETLDMSESPGAIIAKRKTPLLAVATSRNFM